MAKIWVDGEVVHASDLNTWFSDIEDLKDSAADSAETATTEAERATDAVAHNPTIVNGTWRVWDADTSAYVDTGVNATGEDGFSPTLSEAKSGKVTTVTVTDADGTHTFEIHDGQDGAGSGDMLASVYDPQSRQEDIFECLDEKANEPTSYEIDLSAEGWNALDTNEAIYEALETDYPSEQYDIDMFPTSNTDLDIYGKVQFISHINDVGEIDNVIVAIGDVSALINGADLTVGIRLREKVTV